MSLRWFVPEAISRNSSRLPRWTRTQSRNDVIYYLGKMFNVILEGFLKNLQGFFFAYLYNILLQNETYKTN